MAFLLLSDKEQRKLLNQYTNVHVHVNPASLEKQLVYSLLSCLCPHTFKYSIRDLIDSVTAL